MTINTVQSYIQSVTISDLTSPSFFQLVYSHSPIFRHPLPITSISIGVIGYLLIYILVMVRVPLDLCNCCLHNVRHLTLELLEMRNALGKDLLHAFDLERDVRLDILRIRPICRELPGDTPQDTDHH